MLSLDTGGVTPFTLTGDTGDLMLESESSAGVIPRPVSDTLLRAEPGLEESALDEGLEFFFLGDR